MSRHTKGPWFVTQTERWSAYPHKFGLIIVSDEEPGDVQSNAAMASASPELFDALNKMLDCFEGQIPLDLFELSESAISKARGEL